MADPRDAVVTARLRRIARVLTYTIAAQLALACLAFVGATWAGLVAAVLSLLLIICNWAAFDRRFQPWEAHDHMDEREKDLLLRAQARAMSELRRVTTVLMGALSLTLTLSLGSEDQKLPGISPLGVLLLVWGLNEAMRMRPALLVLGWSPALDDDAVDGVVPA